MIYRIEHLDGEDIIAVEYCCSSHCHSVRCDQLETEGQYFEGGPVPTVDESDSPINCANRHCNELLRKGLENVR